ncbi:MAG: hypothetical protein ACTSUN_09275 [Promethearchaeota archaeon]
MEEKAEMLVKETKILNIARLAKMLVDLFGLEEPFRKVGKREGQEIEMFMPALNGYITFILSSDKENFDCKATPANNPVSKIIINVKEEKILTILSNIIRSKNNMIGLIKLLKYLLPGRIKVKGSFIAAIKLVRCLMIGTNPIYKEKW